MTDFTETRSMLKKLVMAHGADTPVGHACHNLLEMTENYAKSSNEEQKRQLVAAITRGNAHLDVMLKRVTQWR